MRDVGTGTGLVFDMLTPRMLERQRTEMYPEDVQEPEAVIQNVIDRVAVP